MAGTPLSPCANLAKGVVHACTQLIKYNKY
jgi:hypothetical protein